MSRSSDRQTRETTDDLKHAGLTDVQVNIDRSGVAYLTGSVDTSDDEAMAVGITQDHGAYLVIDGIVAPDQAMPELHRHHQISVDMHAEPKEITAEQKLLSGDLSDRVFNSTTRQALETGSPLVTNTKL